MEMPPELDVKEVRLIVERWHAAQIFEQGWPFAARPRIEVEKRVEHAGAMLAHMIQEVATQRECMARYPKDWWEAVKARFAPGWFLKRYPVQWSVIDMEVLYPKVAIPRLQHTIRLVQYDVIPGCEKEYTS
jgi:hypothetical protein